MRFLFVNKIIEMGSMSIKGLVEFGPREPWRVQKPSGGDLVRVSVISEAVGQIVSWLSLRNTDFSGRPVFLFASNINLGEGVPVGSVVELEAEISDQSSESFVFSGRALFDGRTVVEVQDCGGYLMPLAELEDPNVTRARFNSLRSSVGLTVNPGGPAFDLAGLVDGVDACTRGLSITARKAFSSTELFYADHFPRFPVTPIVVINEMIGRVTTLMMTEIGGADMMLIPKAIQDLKIRSFIKPNSMVVVSIKKVEDDGRCFETIAEILQDGKRILRGRYRYARD